MKFEYIDTDNHLIELLLGTNMTIAEMAVDMRESEDKICQRIKMLGLDWIPKKNRKVSRGQSGLTAILQKLIPGERIVNEYHIGEQLRLDIFCPQYKLAVEYHGRQHFEWVFRFHETYDEFVRAKQRDERKIELCKQQGIILVAFRYCDQLDEDSVYDRLLEAMRLVADDETPVLPKSRYSVKNNPQYQDIKTKKNAYQRDLRKRIKQERKIREQDRATENEEPDYMVDD